MTTSPYHINSDKIMSDTIDNEVIIIHFESGTYYSMQPAGSEIWARLTQQAPVDTIAGELSRSAH
jgi:hypothetical protein